MFSVLLLAATIAQSVEPAVEKVLQVHAERILRLEHQLAERKRIMDNFTGCLTSAFVVAGLDLVSTAAAREGCPMCAEQNPLAIGDVGLVGLKLAQLGSQVAVCKKAADKSTRGTKIVTWTNRAIHGIAIGLNTYSAISGKPVIRWR